MKRFKIFRLEWALEKGLGELSPSLPKFFKDKFGEKTTFSKLIAWLQEINRKEIIAWLLGQDDIKVIKAVINSGIDLEEFGDAAIRWASALGNIETLKFLASRHKNGSSEHKLALFLASRRGHLEVVKFLIKNEITSMRTNEEAIKYAITKNNPEIVEILEKQNRKLDAQSV